MPSLYLPRAPFDSFVYDFLYVFSGIVGGIAIRRIYTCLRPSCDFYTNSRGLIRKNHTEAAQRLHGNRAISVQSSRSIRKLSMETGTRAASVKRLKDIYGNMSTENFAFFAIS